MSMSTTYHNEQRKQMSPIYYLLSIQYYKCESLFVTLWLCTCRIEIFISGLIKMKFDWIILCIIAENTVNVLPFKR